MDVHFCKKCVMPSSRPGIKFNDDGLCAACVWHEQKKHIDWEDRTNQFQRIADWARKVSRSAFDCVLGVSGGKDSLWQAMALKEKFGMNPLLVQFVSADGTDLGRRNAENMVEKGFTLLNIQPNPIVACQLARKSFLEYGNIAKYSEFSLFSAPFRTAVDYDIPLVLFGENPALEAGDTNQKFPGWDASGIRYNNTLAGAQSDIWLGDGVKRKDLIFYNFPPEEDLVAWGGRGVFMGYFLNWSGWKNGLFAIENGMDTHKAPYDDIGIHYKHNSLDSDFCAAINSMLKYTKLGFGHATEFTSYDVRDGRITRREAAALIKRLDGRCSDRYIDRFCQWIDISRSKFDEVKESYYGRMWEKGSCGQWQLRNPVWKEYDDVDDVDTDAIIARLDTIRIAKEGTHGFKLL